MDFPRVYKLCRLLSEVGASTGYDLNVWKLLLRQKDLSVPARVQLQRLSAQATHTA
jgi:hypothetical protein